MKEGDEEVAGETEVSNNTEKFSFKKHPYTVWVLILILFGKMTNQWARKIISYSFGFSMGDGLPGREFYEISTFYP